MSDNHLTPDQTEALQEISNVAMGRAGDALARLLNVFVRLSVPRIRPVQGSDLVGALGQVQGDAWVAAVRQGFHHTLRGEALVLFGQEGRQDLAAALGHAHQRDSDDEMLLELGNLLVGACLCGIGEQIGADLGFSPPVLMAEQTRPIDLVDPNILHWRRALLVEIEFGLEHSAFVSHVLILLAEDSLPKLREALDRFLAELGL